MLDPAVRRRRRRAGERGHLVAARAAARPCRCELGQHLVVDGVVDRRTSARPGRSPRRRRSWRSACPRPPSGRRRCGARRPARCPGPTLRHGLPAALAAATAFGPPVVQMKSTPGWWKRYWETSSVGSGIDLERVGGQPGAPRRPPGGSRPPARAQRAARAEGRKIIALRVLAATIALNSTVEVGLVIGSSASTTPIGSATYWMPRSGVLVDHADRPLVLEVVVEELGGDVVLDHLVLEARRSRSPPSRARASSTACSEARRRPSPRRSGRPPPGRGGGRRRRRSVRAPHRRPAHPCDRRRVSWPAAAVRWSPRSGRRYGGRERPPSVAYHTIGSVRTRSKPRPPCAASSTCTATSCPASTTARATSRDSARDGAPGAAATGSRWSARRRTSATTTTCEIAGAGRAGRGAQRRARARRASPVAVAAGRRGGRDGARGARRGGAARGCPLGGGGRWVLLEPAPGPLGDIARAARSSSWPSAATGR